jgi:hypothetical protein
VDGNPDAGAVIVGAADDLLVAELPVADLPVAVTSTPDDERYEVRTLAELFEYVSAAWDSGGSSYCATKTWFSCGLDDAFQRLASKEGLSTTERSALSARMRNAMPLCRNCRCEPSRALASPREPSRWQGARPSPQQRAPSPRLRRARRV